MVYNFYKIGIFSALLHCDLGEKHFLSFNWLCASAF